MKSLKTFPLIIASLMMLSACGEPASTSAESEPINESSVISVEDSCDHSYDSPTYTWSEDNSTCTAERVCVYNANHMQTETVSTTYTVETVQGCGQEGHGYYTATFTNRAFRTQTKYVTSPALEHIWGDPVYKWNEKNTVCVATKTCQRNNTHVIREEVRATVETPILPTADTAGMMRFTAEFTRDSFTTQVKEIEMTLEEYTEFNIKFELNEDGNSYAVQEVLFYYELEEINIPSTYKGLPVTVIKSGACERYSLHRITLPDTIIKIEGGAFDSEGLSKLVLSENLVVMDASISVGSFLRLQRTELNKIAYIGTRTNPYFCCIGGFNYESEAQWDNIHNQCKIISSVAWMTVGSSSRTVLPIREGVVCLSPGALAGLTNLTSSQNIATIQIPSTLRHIGNGAITDFQSLTTFEIAEGNASFKLHEDGYLMTMDEKTIVRAPRYLNSTDIVIPDTVIYIQPYAFERCLTAMTVVLPDDIHIGTYAFCYSGLVAIDFHFVLKPGTTRWEYGMPYGIFYYASNLATATFRDTIREFKALCGTTPGCFEKTAVRKVTCTDGVYEWSY